MPALTATGQARRLRLSAVLCISLLLSGTSAAQPFPFGLTNPEPTGLTPPRVDLVAGPTAARLKQAEVLAANENWPEALDIYRELIAEDAGRLVAVDEDLFFTLRRYCHWRLAALPAEALAMYRRQVDPLAERWYRGGVAGLDAELLRRVVDEYFCSSWGDDALLALGEMALERADYAAARRAWEQISPLLRSPNGLPPWIALRGVDLAAHGPKVERRWLERSQPTWLAYPDTQFELADLRARLILVSLRAGQRERARLELNLFRQFHPRAIGRLGGQEGPYLAALERLLTSAGEWAAEPRDGDWPTFAGSPTRAHAAPPLPPDLKPTWPAPVSVTPPEFVRTDSRRPLVPAFDHTPVPVRESQRPLSCFPVVVDEAVVFSDATGVRVVDLSTGKPAVTSDGVIYRNETVDASNVQGQAVSAVSVAHGVPRYTLTVADGVVYGRAGRLATTLLEADRTSARDWLVGLDLDRDGLLTFRAQSTDASWSFDGAPVSDGRRLYVAMRHSGVSPHAYVACYDASTGSRLWRTPIGSAESPAAGRGDEITHNLLTLVGTRIYFNTNLGLVAALDTQDGRICWLHRYERDRSRSPSRLHFDRDPSPCLYHEGLLIVAPCDAPIIFALDALTGKTVWSTDKLADGLHLLGVVQHNLVVGGHRLAALDVRSGAVRFIWPESGHAGIRGMGRGVIAGEEVFWPTRNEIYVIHAVTGEQTRSPIPLASISDCGANLLASRGRLVVAGYDKLMAYGPINATKP